MNNSETEAMKNAWKQCLIEICTMHKEIRTLIWHTDETTKAINKLIRKQEKLKNFINGDKND